MSKPITQEQYKEMMKHIARIYRYLVYANDGVLFVTKMWRLSEEVEAKLQELEKEEKKDEQKNEICLSEKYITDQIKVREELIEEIKHAVNFRLRGKVTTTNKRDIPNQSIGYTIAIANFLDLLESFKDNTSDKDNESTNT